MKFLHFHKWNTVKIERWVWTHTPGPLALRIYPDKTPWHEYGARLSKECRCGQRSSEVIKGVDADHIAWLLGMEVEP